ncbi:MAG: RnfABCDGE type electron transport complex subunit D [Gammaproteobacteria bacterium]|nr:MAG: RnfABCDGE type electron transport complex subunit D [Gammaproteobacteria bacterium]
MDFPHREAPYVGPKADVAALMLQVLAALVPAALAHIWFFGPGFLFNLLVAAIFAAAGEIVMLRLRSRQAETGLSDFSALVTAALLAFALPSLTPWWVTASGALFAIVIAKHLYGGLGFNIFNPAMAGYVMILVAFPVHLNLWVAPRMGDIDYQTLTMLQTLQFTLTGLLPDSISFDAISRATPLDAMKAGLNNMQTVTEIKALPIMGSIGGRGWEWVGIFLAVGGIWLLIKRIIRWQIPAGVGIGLLLPATIIYILDPGANPGPGFHLFGGGAILCAFFIATDPVSAASSPKGRFVFGLGVGLLIYAIRRWGSYSDGVAFAILIMNMSVPAIDYLTRPHIVGHEDEAERH